MEHEKSLTHPWLVQILLQNREVDHTWVTILGNGYMLGVLTEREPAQMIKNNQRKTIYTLQLHIIG